MKAADDKANSDVFALIATRAVAGLMQLGKLVEMDGDGDDPLEYAEVAAQRFARIAAERDRLREEANGLRAEMVNACEAAGIMYRDRAKLESEIADLAEELRLLKTSGKMRGVRNYVHRIFHEQVVEKLEAACVRKDEALTEASYVLEREGCDAHARECTAEVGKR